MAAHVAQHESPGARRWAVRCPNRQGGPWRPRWWLGTSILLLVVVLASSGASGSVGGSLAGLLWQRADASAPARQESLGAAGGLHDALALTGPRGISVAGVLHEGRQRASQVVEPGAASTAGTSGGPGYGLRFAAPRPVLLAVRGLFAGRGPPSAQA